MATGRGVGGLIYGDAVRLPAFDIGPYAMNGVAAYNGGVANVVISRHRPTERLREQERLYGDRQRH